MNPGVFFLKLLHLTDRDLGIPKKNLLEGRKTGQYRCCAGCYFCACQPQGLQCRQLFQGIQSGIAYLGIVKGKCFQICKRKEGLQVLIPYRHFGQVQAHQLAFNFFQRAYFFGIKTFLYEKSRFQCRRTCGYWLYRTKCIVETFDRSH